MLVDVHYENCGITIYINHSLTIESMKEQLHFIIVISEEMMRERIEQLWWERFLNYCHTGE